MTLEDMLLLKESCVCHLDIFMSALLSLFDKYFLCYITIIANTPHE